MTTDEMLELAAPREGPPMTGIARAARWAGGALAELGVRDLAGALTVILIAVLALCWVLADEDRSRRLTGILGAWRGTRPRPVDRPGKAAGRQRRAAVAGSGPPTPPGSAAPPAG